MKTMHVLQGEQEYLWGTHLKKHVCTRKALCVSGAQDKLCLV